MNEAEYHRLASATLFRIEQAVEVCGADIEFENVSDILTLEFANGSKIIVNKQTPARQLWVAAKSGGFHYDYDPASQSWRRRPAGTELFADLSRLASEQSGATITLT